MSLAEFWYASPFYRPFLSGKPPQRLLHLPPPGRPGLRERGNAICGGLLTIGREGIRLESAPWAAGRLSPPAEAELQSFGWLDDLAAADVDGARDMARRLVASWIDDHEDWSVIAWAPAILGRRVAHWLTHAPLLAQGTNDPLDRRILASLTRQLRHLRRTAARCPDPRDRLVALRGLIYGIVCGVAPGASLSAALRALTEALNQQLLPDGGHISRSPSVQFQTLAVTVDCRDMLAIGQHSTPPEIEAVVGRMSLMLRFYRHGDGRLAVFNGSREGDGVLLDTVLERKSAASLPLSAPESGFERISAGPTLVLIDTGSLPYAGTLALELSHGEERIVVNCGPALTAGPGWVDAQRSTAAHSTLTVDNTNSSDLLGSSRRARVLELVRENSGGNTWITASHDGYRENFGLLHRRRLYLSADGTDVRGEDALSGTHRGQSTVRFHLHPDVSASLVQNGAAVLLRLISGSAWRFEARGGTLGLEESLYTAGASGRRRTEQITIITPLVGEDIVIKWALRRIAL